MLTCEGVTQIHLWLRWISPLNQLCISWQDHQFSSQVILTTLLQITPDMHSKILLWCFSWLKKIWLYVTKSSSHFQGLWWERKHKFYCLIKSGILASKCLVCFDLCDKMEGFKVCFLVHSLNRQCFFFHKVMAKKLV